MPPTDNRRFNWTEKIFFFVGPESRVSERCESFVPLDHKSFGGTVLPCTWPAIFRAAISSESRRVMENGSKKRK